MSAQIYPLVMQPVYKDHVWGGDRIIRMYGRDEPPGTYAESWEVSDRDDGMSTIANGAWRGRPLREVVEAWGSRLLGEAPRSASGHFPLLIKLIDSRERLSLQVHPDDETSARYGGEAKTEMWCILEADPGAKVFAGLRQGVDAAAFQEAVAGQGIEEIVVPVPVAKGDAVFTPGGCVHAIDAGCLILEVQQNSNTTYRIHDWGRVGADGEPRALHLEEALRVIRWDDTAEAKIKPSQRETDGTNELWEVLRCPYFRTERLEVREPWACPMNGKTFHVLFVSEGSVGLHWEGGEEETLVAGSSCLVPADLGGYRLDPLHRDTVAWRVSHP